MANLSIAILGLNRTSASAGLALKRYMKKGGKHKFTVTGYDRDNENVKLAKKMEAVDKTENRPRNAVQNADIILMAMSYEEVEKTYKDIRNDLRDGSVILDMSPLKQPSLKWADELFTSEQHLIGMTAIFNPAYLFNAKESIGEAEEDLFDNSAILLTPPASAVKEAVDLAFNFASILGSKPRFLDPLEHDALLAQTVQLPRLLGTVLFYDLARQATWEDLKWLTNPDFGVLTRHLFDFHPDALRDEFFSNRETLGRMVDGYIATLTEFREALRGDDIHSVEAAIVDTAEIYENWINSRYKANWDASQTPPPKVEGGMLQGLLGAKLADKITGKGDED